MKNFKFNKVFDENFDVSFQNVNDKYIVIRNSDVALNDTLTFILKGNCYKELRDKIKDIKYYYNGQTTKKGCYYITDDYDFYCDELDKSFENSQVSEISEVQEVQEIQQLQQVQQPQQVQELKDVSEVKEVKERKETTIDKINDLSDEDLENLTIEKINSFGSITKEEVKQIPNEKRKKIIVKMIEKMKIQRVQNFKKTVNLNDKPPGGKKEEYEDSGVVIPKHLYPSTDDELWYVFFILNKFQTGSSGQRGHYLLCRYGNKYFRLFNIYHNNIPSQTFYKLLCSLNSDKDELKKIINE